VESLKSFSFAPEILASASLDEVFVWNNRSENVELKGHSGSISAPLALHSQQPFLARGSNDGTLSVWSLDDDTTENRILNSRLNINAFHSPVSSIVFHPSEVDRLLCASQSAIGLFDMRTGSKSDILIEYGACAMDWNRKSQDQLVTGDLDGIVRLWDLRSTRQSLGQSRLHSERIRVLSWNPHLPSIFACAGSEGVFLCDSSSLGSSAIGGGVIFHHIGHGGAVDGFEWSNRDPLLCMSMCSVDGFTSRASLQIWRSADWLWLGRDKFVHLLRECGTAQ
jgi:WD40 repeat protein